MARLLAMLRRRSKSLRLALSRLSSNEASWSSADHKAEMSGIIASTVRADWCACRIAKGAKCKVDSLSLVLDIDMRRSEFCQRKAKLSVYCDCLEAVRKCACEF